MIQRVGGNQPIQTTTLPEDSGRIGKRSVETAPGMPRLDRIKGTEPPKGNFLTRAFESVQTKMTRTGRSVDKHAGLMLGALDRPPGKELNGKKLLGEIVSLRKHFTHMAEVSKKPVDPTLTLQLALAGRLSGMDNLQVMNLHRTFLSEATTRLRSALEAEIRRNPANHDARHCLEDLGVIEVTLLMEISGRIARNDSPTPIPPLQERLTARSGKPEHSAFIVPNESRPANVGLSPSGKLTDKGLEILVESGGRSALLHDKSLGKDAENRLERKGFNLDARKVGDVMRDADLTMNFNLHDFFGIGRTTKPIDDCNTMRNMFQWGAKPDQTNEGALKRDMTERQFFESLQRSGLDPDSRPTYGALDVGRQSKGGAEFYGYSYFVLKPEVKQRCTFTTDDTFNVPRCKATPENLRALSEKLTGPSSELSDSGREFFARSNGENLQKLLKGLESKGEFSTTNLQSQIMGMFGGAGLGDDKDEDCVARLVQSTLLDEHATHAQVTGYDNIENLLSHLDDARLNRMMQAVESPAKGNFRMGNYIEAQIHGAVAYGEDVKALRVSEYDLTQVARKSQGAYSVETARAKLTDFCEKNGIELSFYDDGDQSIDREQTRNESSLEKYQQAHGDPEIRTRQHRETQSALNAFVDVSNTGPNGFSHQLTTTCTRLGIDVTSLNPTNVARIRQELVAAVGKVSENGRNEVGAGRIEDIARQAIGKFIQAKVDLLAEVTRLPTSEENKSVFRSFVMGSSTLTQPKMLAEVAQSSFIATGMLHMFGDLQSLTDTTHLDNVMVTLQSFVTDTRRRLDNVGKEWGRDDLMLHSERALSLGTSMAKLDPSALSALYAQLTSAAGQELIESLRADSRKTDQSTNMRISMADTLHLLTIMVGRELGKPRPEVESDLRHTLRYDSIQQAPEKFQQSLKNVGLI